MDANQRAKFMETGEASKVIADLHKVSSHEGQSDVPDAEDEVTLHFVCLARVDGVLYEFDGRKSAPVNHGACEESLMLESSVRVAKEFMERDPDNLNFSAIALVGAD
jgi:ubiquitin carboxyl-terminal hydrolase L3